MAKQFSAIAGAAFVAALWSSPTFAQEEVISDMERPTWDFYGDVDIDRVEAENVPGGEMLRLGIAEQGENFWDSGAFSEELPGAIEQGQIVALGFFARAGTEGETYVIANVAEADRPQNTAIVGRVNLTQEGGFYCLEATSEIRLRDGDVKVTLHLAGTEQVVDLGPYVVTVRSPDDGASGLPCTSYGSAW